MGHSPAAGAVTAALRQTPTLICPISWHSRSVPTITAQPQLSCDRPLWLTARGANTRAQRRLLVLSDWLSIIHPHIPYLEPVQLQRAGGTCEGEDSNVLWYTQWRVKVPSEAPAPWKPQKKNQFLTKQRHLPAKRENYSFHDLATVSPDSGDAMNHFWHFKSINCIF